MICINNPKNRQFMGKVQFTMIRDMATQRWLAWALGDLPPGCKVWPSSQPTFSRIFKTVLKALNLERLRLSPGSLRPGGTTHGFRLGVPVANLKHAGRWASESSLAVYIQECMAHLVHNSLSAADVSALQCLEASLPAFWDRPPSAPWQTLFLRARQWKVLQKAAS